MGVDFRGVQMVVAQHLLDGPDVHAVLQHQRGGGVPQLVGAVLRRVDARLTQPLFHHGVDRGAADPLVLRGEEEGVCVPAGDGPPHCQIFGDGVLAGVVQVDDPDLVALAKNPQGIFLDVGEVQTHQLADPQPAVEEQRQDTVIPLLIFAVHGVQKLDALVQGQVFGQGFLQFRRIHIFDRIFTK